MHSYNPNAAGNNEPAMVMVTLCLTAVLCWLYFADFVRWSCWFLYWLWRIADFPQIHRYAAERINLLAATGNGAESVGLSEWRDVMNATAGILFVPMVPLITVTSWALAAGALSIFTHCPASWPPSRHQLFPCCPGIAATG